MHTYLEFLHTYLEFLRVLLRPLQSGIMCYTVYGLHADSTSSSDVGSTISYIYSTLLALNHLGTQCSRHSSRAVGLLQAAIGLCAMSQ